MSALLREINKTGGGVSLGLPGLAFARAAIALARNHNLGDAVADAEATWGPTSAAAKYLRAKSAVAIGSTQPGNWLSSTAEHRIVAAEFVSALRPSTILGKMSGYRRAPAQVKIPRVTSGSTAAWIGEGRPAPAQAIAMDFITLDNFKIGDIVVSTLELIKLSSPDVDGLVRADLLAGVATFLDKALLDPTAAAVAGVSPASITNGGAQIASSGTALSNIATDFKALFAELTGNGILLTSPYLIMAPQTAVALALANLSGAGFIDLGTRGGSTIATVPVLTSTAVANTVIVLVDASELIVCDGDEIELDLSREATLELSTTPTHPVTAATVVTSLWQSDLAAWKVTKPINWTMRRAHAVATLTGVAY